MTESLNRIICPWLANPFAPFLVSTIMCMLYFCTHTIHAFLVFYTSEILEISPGKRDEYAHSIYIQYDIVLLCKEKSGAYYESVNVLEENNKKHFSQSSEQTEK